MASESTIDEIKSMRARIHDITKTVNNLDKDVTVMTQVNQQMRKDIYDRLEDFKQVEHEQNESIRDLVKDTRALREKQIRQDGRQDGSQSMRNFLASNWFQLLLVLLVIFSLFNEEAILHLLK